MSRASVSDRAFAVAAFSLAAIVLLAGLGRHGIWDPAELTFAEAVRAGERFVGRPPWHGGLARLGFQLFGRADWSGRFFGALSTLGAVGAGMVVARRIGDARTAGYAAILGVASPLVVLNARWMVGDGGTFLAQSMVGCGAIVLAFAPGGVAPSRVDRVLGALLVVGGAVLGLVTRGALLTSLPPLLAVTALVVVDRDGDASVRRTRLVLAAVGALLAVALAWRVMVDADAYDLLLGGVPGGEQPPSFEKYLQIAFHTLAPVSPLFVLGAARVVRGRPDADSARIELMLALWAAIGFGATTLFASRYGTPAFASILPIAVLAARLLRDIELDDGPDVTAAVAAGMMYGLLIRDFALYPISPIAGVAAPAPVLGPEFQPRAVWAALFGASAALLALGSAAHTVRSLAPLRQRPRAVVAAIRARTSTRLGKVAVGLTVALVVLAEVSFLVLGFAGARLHLASIAVRAFKALALALPLAFVALMALELALRAFERLGRYRMMPVVLACGAAGAFVQGPFLVELSGDLSPREVYARYNELRTEDDVLVEFGLSTHAAAYYARGRVDTVENEQQLVEHLKASGRRWALFPRGVLPQVNRLYRAAKGRHLYIADARNAEVVLAAGAPIEGLPDENPIARAFVREASPQHRTNIRFSEVELIGYDLELPGGSTVGAGQAFRITWYWKVIATPTADWKVFLHIDGEGQRLNGDHDPVEGLLPMRQWTVGDIVKDSQRLDVPVSYPSTQYTLFVGFFHGETRMPIVSGEHTPDNRAIAGRLTVQ